MNAKLPRLIVIMVLVGTPMFAPKAALAFWPFDSYEHGQVQGEQTQVPGGFFQALFKRAPKPMMTPNPSMMPFPSGEMPERIDDKLTTDMLGKRLDEAVKNGKMTEAQKTAVLTHLKGIETKRKELRDLEKAFQEWLKTNKVILPFLFRPAAPESMFSQGVGPSGATGFREMKRPIDPRLLEKKIRMDNKGTIPTQHPTEAESDDQ